MKVQKHALNVEQQYFKNPIATDIDMRSILLEVIDLWQVNHKPCLLNS